MGKTKKNIRRGRIAVAFKISKAKVLRGSHKGRKPGNSDRQEPLWLQKEFPPIGYNIGIRYIRREENVEDVTRDGFD